MTSLIYAITTITHYEQPLMRCDRSTASHPSLNPFLPYSFQMKTKYKNRFWVPRPTSILPVKYSPQHPANFSRRFPDRTRTVTLELWKPLNVTTITAKPASVRFGPFQRYPSLPSLASRLLFIPPERRETRLRIHDGGPDGGARRGADGVALGARGGLAAARQRREDGGAGGHVLGHAVARAAGAARGRLPAAPQARARPPSVAAGPEREPGCAAARARRERLRGALVRRQHRHDAVQQVVPARLGRRRLPVRDHHDVRQHVCQDAALAHRGPRLSQRHGHADGAPGARRLLEAGRAHRPVHGARHYAVQPVAVLHHGHVLHDRQVGRQRLVRFVSSRTTSRSPGAHLRRSSYLMEFTDQTGVYDAGTCYSRSGWATSARRRRCSWSSCSSRRG